MSALPPPSFIPSKMIDIDVFFPGIKCYEEVETILVHFNIDFPPDGFERSLVKAEWMGRRVRREEGRKKEEGEGWRDIVVEVLIQTTVDGWTLIFDEEMGGRMGRSGGGEEGGGEEAEVRGEGKEGREEAGEEERGGEKAYEKVAEREGGGREDEEKEERGEKEGIKEEELSSPIFTFRTRSLEVKLLEDDRVEMKELKAKSLFAKRKSVIVKFETKMETERFFMEIGEIIREESNTFSLDHRDSFKEEVNLSQRNSVKVEEVKEEEGNVKREEELEKEREGRIIEEITEKEQEEKKEKEEELRKSDNEMEKKGENEMRKSADQLDERKNEKEKLEIEESEAYELRDEEENEI